MRWIRPYCLSKVNECLVLFTEGVEQIPKVVVRIGKIRINLQRLAVVTNRLVESSRLLERYAKIVASRC